MFNVGDTVKCVNSCSSSLTEGNLYTVKAISNGFIRVYSDDLKDRRDGWMPYRFEKVKENNMSNYPTLLGVGDRLKTNTGREYVVTSVDDDHVTYAYIPAKYDNRSEKKIELDTRRKSNLTWVDKVLDSEGKKVWPQPKFHKGDPVMFKGVSFSVERVFNNYINIIRSVRVDELDK